MLFLLNPLHLNHIGKSLLKAGARYVVNYLQDLVLSQTWCLAYNSP